MRRLCLLTAFLAAGCANGGPTVTDTAALIDQQAAQCRERYPSKRGHFTDQARCINEANALLPGHNDLGDMLAKRRIAIAAKMDAGTLSREDGEAEIAKARVEANSERKRRTASQASVRALQEAAGPRTCHAVGSIVNCY